MKRYQSSSSRDTERLGSTVARKLLTQGPRGHAAVFALSGELGAGKTTFVKGFFRGLAIKARAQSPTFVLVRRHGMRKKGFKNVFHIDAYRVKTLSHLGDVLGPVPFRDPSHIFLIEWPERIRHLLPRGTKWFTFGHGRSFHERMITLP